jgi:hypothetical protein
VVAAAPAAAANPPRVIVGDRSVAGLRLGRTTPPVAIARFGADGPRRLRRSGGSCTVAWPRIGLTLHFGVIGTDPTNPCTGGHLLTATVTSRGAWRTAVGLRVGDRVTRLRSLYPRAVFNGGAPFGFDRGYWLVTRRSCPTVGGATYPGLLARTNDGRVTALVVQVGVCD